MSNSENVTEPDLSARSGRFTIFGFPLAALAFLGLTVAISLIWSHYKLVVPDELHVLQPDSVSSFSELVHVQRVYMVPIDPLFYHAVEHAVISLFGNGPMALRLLSLLGFLTMQVCLFIFVRRVASERAAIFALAFPALTLTFYYSTHARPYGVLLALFALTMVSWQTAIRKETHRTLALVVLALAVAMTLNTHFFGVLILVPLCGAEMFRSIERRRLDYPVIASIAAGMAGYVFVIPFMKGAAEYRAHYYNNGQADIHILLQAYRVILMEPIQASARMQHLQAICLVLLAVPLVWLLVRQLRSRNSRLTGAEAVFLILLATLPFFWYLLGRYVVHSLEIYYVLGSLVGISALLAIAFEPFLSREKACKIALFVLFAAIACAGFLRIRAAQRDRQAFMSTLIVSPEAKAALLANPGQPLYFDDLFKYEMAQYYEPDYDLQARLFLTYSNDQELYWDHANSTALTVEHFTHYTNLPIVRYESVVAKPGDQLFVIYPADAWDWLGNSFAASHTEVKQLGTAFGGELVSVRFQP